jgi:hypothetical protein
MHAEGLCEMHMEYLNIRRHDKEINQKETNGIDVRNREGYLKSLQALWNVQAEGIIQVLKC